MKLGRFLEYQYLFVFLALIFGFELVFTNPPWQTNDEDRHFYNAYALTEGSIGPKVQDEDIGQYLPRNLVQTVNSFQRINFSDKVKIRKSAFEDFKSVENDRDSIVFCKNPTSTILPFAYLPSAAGISLAKVMDKSPIEIGWFGRAGDLIAYIIIIFFAIQMLPYGRPLLTAAALTPMALYQGASVSYDGMSFALLFLYFSLVVKYSFHKDPLKLEHVLWLIAVAFLQRLCKDGYTILFFVALILPSRASRLSDRKGRSNYSLLIVGLVAASFLPGFLWDAYLNSLHIPDRALNSFQKDFIFNSSMNLKYHLAHPLNAITLGVENSIVQGKDWLVGATGRFGYSYTKLPAAVSLACWLIIAASCLFQTPYLSRKMFLAFFIVGFLAATAIVYGFLVAGSPVGANFIFGLQGRYFTPIIPFLFAGAFQVKLADVSQATLKWILVLASGAILIYTVHFLDNSFYYKV